MASNTRVTSRRRASTEPRYPIESVDNALRLLLLLRTAPTITVAEASRAVDVAPSTAHRLLAMLQHYGFVQRDARTRQYRAGDVLTEIGLAALRDFDIRDVMRPALEELVRRVGETAHFTVLRGTSVVFLDGVETDKALRAAARTGETLPAHASANGKAQLALLPDEEVKALYRSERLPRVTDRTLATRTALLEQLVEIRTLGYATQIGESEVGMVSVAAAVCTQEGICRGSIAVAGPDVRFSADDIPKAAQIVKDVAKTAATWPSRGS